MSTWNDTNNDQHADLIDMLRNISIICAVSVAGLPVLAFLLQMMSPPFDLLIRIVIAGDIAIGAAWLGARPLVPLTRAIVVLLVALCAAGASLWVTAEQVHTHQLYVERVKHARQAETESIRRYFEILADKSDAAEALRASSKQEFDPKTPGGLIAGEKRVNAMNQIAVHSSKMISQRNGIQKQFESLSFKDSLSPASLADPQKVQETDAKMNRFVDLVHQRDDMFKSYVNGVRDILEKADLEPADRSDFIHNYEPTVRKTEALMADLSRSQLGTAQLVQSMLKFVTINRGSFKLQGNKLMFTSVPVLSAYNMQIQSINASIIDNQAMEKRATAVYTDAQSNVDTQLNKLP